MFQVLNHHNTKNVSIVLGEEMKLIEFKEVTQCFDFVKLTFKWVVSQSSTTDHKSN